MLSDKPVAAVCETLGLVAAQFFCAGLPPPRGLREDQLADIVRSRCAATSAHATVADALHEARAAAGPLDRIVVCGSFLTVAAALEEARWGT